MRKPSSVAVVLAVAFVLLAGLTFRDYGITYDEDLRVGYGRTIVAWYTSGFSDQAALRGFLTRDQGGFASVVAWTAAKATGLDPFTAAHLVVPAFALLVLLATYLLGRELAGDWCGLLAAGLVALAPRFYGDAFNNLADMSFAATTGLFLVLLVRALPSLSRLSWSAAIALGVCLGLSLAIRITAVLWLAFLVLACLFSWLGEERTRPLLLRVRSYAWTVFRVSAVAYLAMLPWWPAALVSPVLEPLRALAFAARTLRRINNFQVLFDGSHVATIDLPWDYVPRWFALTLPEFFLVALLIAAIMALATMLAAARSAGVQGLVTALWRHPRARAFALVTAFALFPFAVEAISGAVHYDGIRHFLFLLPPLGALAGSGVLAFSERVHSRALQWATWSALAVSAAITVWDMYALHPYQYVYFNRLVAGGMARAATRYETDYWGASLREGAEWLTRYVGERGPTEPKPSVASCLQALSSSRFLSPRVVRYLGSVHDGQPIPKGAQPDYFLATPRWGCDDTYPGRVIHRVERRGATLMTVIEVDRTAATRADASGSTTGRSVTPAVNQTAPNTPRTTRP